MALVKRAGLRLGRVRTVNVERVQPLSDTDREYFETTVFRDTWGERLRPYLSDVDWLALRNNTDPASPGYCLDRDDFHHLQTLTVCESFA